MSHARSATAWRPRPLGLRQHRGVAGPGARRHDGPDRQRTRGLQRGHLHRPLQRRGHVGGQKPAGRAGDRPHPPGAGLAGHPGRRRHRDVGPGHPSRADVGRGRRAGRPERRLRPRVGGPPLDPQLGRRLHRRRRELRLRAGPALEPGHRRNGRGRPSPSPSQTVAPGRPGRATSRCGGRTCSPPCKRAARQSRPVCGFDVRDLTFETWLPSDPGVVFSAELGTMAGYELVVEAPDANRVYMLGKREGPDRQWRLVQNDPSVGYWWEVEAGPGPLRRRRGARGRRRGTAPRRPVARQPGGPCSVAGLEALAELDRPVAVKVTPIDVPEPAVRVPLRPGRPRDRGFP